jgi:hypothetical protein
MERGRVLPDAAVAWCTGQVPARVYFTLARRRATAAAALMVHDLVDGDRRRLVLPDAGVALRAAARNNKRKAGQSGERG